MSATPASRETASAAARKSRSRWKTSVTSEIRSMNTNERCLRKTSCRACRMLRKNVLALVTDVETSHSTNSSGRRGRRGRYFSCTGTPPVCSDARIVARTSTWACRLCPRSSCPWEASRRRSCATTLCTAARSCTGPPGSERSRSVNARFGGSAWFRSIWPRSSSRRSACSKRRSWSRETPSRRGSSAARSGCGSVRKPSARRIRWTSTPSTPDPWPLPKAAIASRARSRRSESDPSSRARAICRRSSSRSTSSPPTRVCGSETSSRTACSSVARKKKRSKTRSKTRRSSGDLAIVVASVSRKSAGALQFTSSSALNASSISEVPTATPSERRSSANATICPSKSICSPGTGANLSCPALRRLGGLELDPDTLGHRIQIRAVLDDHAHRLAEGGLVDVGRAEQQQSPGPVDRLGDARWLLEIQLPDHLDDLHELARDGLRELGRVHADDLELVLQVRVVEPQVEAAALQRLGQLTAVVGREQHHRVRLRLDAAKLRDRDLEVRQQLEQHRLELLVGLVDLVDQQDDRALGADRGEQRAREQELLAEDVVLDLRPAGVAGLGLDPQQLLAVVPLVQRLGLVEALVALQPHQLAVQVERQRLRELGLAHARGALDEHGLVKADREVGDERGRGAREIAGAAQARGDGVDRVGKQVHLRHHRKPGERPALTRRIDRRAARR